MVSKLPRDAGGAFRFTSLQLPVRAFS